MSEKWILMVDDDPADREILQDALTERSPETRMEYAGDAEEAIKRLRDGSPLPYLIVLDLNMPRITGSVLLAIIKSDPQLKSIAVIIYSTSINPIEKEKCLALGAMAFFTKPGSYRESIDIADALSTFCR